ncbi:hypothetical protein Palpr_1691 [Paludibacter propionicigenes WB4]|uniref:Uncharacterized protein n=1 Tax=Paludibacter propionicigenes (strain DSM 17365 / JCM 13257 / WB4) TaxID=694427 RepID=E4T538_PALPW|nr:hypothetical protein [Paludibacter propionicigenes]ADQ79832.1 hypothetical protein Palpr_1691 [Paludibacter propionicigenes WB4]
MKKIILFAAICIITVNVFSQGSGEITVYPNHFYHSPHNYGEIKSLTIKWNFRTLFGEPVIDGVFKWETGNNTPANFMDYRDYVLLKCAPIKMNTANGHILNFYIAISPTVPRAGEGYGFNTPGSPSWNDVFIHSLWEKRQGENKYRLDINYLPYKTVGDYAKAIWKEGFKVIDAELMRAGGLDADKTTKSNSSTNNDVRNTSENALTQSNQKQKEAIDRQKQLTQQAKDKYKALKKPYILNITNRDTVSEASLQVLKALNPYFQNGILALSSVSNGKIISKANTLNANLQLAEGWNTLRISIKEDNYILKDSVRVYYKKSSRKVLLFDDFSSEVIDKNKWTYDEERSPIIKDGALILRSKSIETKEMQLSSNQHKIIVELKYQYRTELTKNKSLMGTSISRDLKAGLYFEAKNPIDSYIFHSSNAITDNNTIYITSRNTDSEKRLSFNANEDTWIEEKCIFIPDEGRFEIYVNGTFLGSLHATPMNSKTIKIILNVGDRFSISQFKTDYIKIYQEE